MATDIKTALYGDLDVKVTIQGKVFGVGPLETYLNKQNKKMSFFMATVADSTAVCKIRIYNSKRESIIENRSYRFKNVVRKFGGFWCIGTSRVCAWASIDIPDSISEKAAYEITISKETPNTPRKLKDAVESVTTSHVVGKVVQVSPLKFVRNGELPLKFVSLKDYSSTVKLALFNKDAETEYNEGDVLSVNDVYRYRETETLSTKTSAKVEFMDPNSLILDVSVQDFLDDPDFMFDPQALERNMTPSEFAINGVERVNVYVCCSKIGCKRKKVLSDGSCPYCKERPTTDDSYYCYAVCIIKHDGEENSYTLFYDDLIKLLEMPEIFKTSRDLMEFLSRNLPICGMALFDNNHISIVPNLKRKREDK